MSESHENENKIIQEIEKIDVTKVGKQIYRGRNFIHYKITDSKYLELLKEQSKGLTPEVIVFGESTWVKAPNQFDSDKRPIYYSYTVDGKYTETVSNPNDDHEVAFGMVGFKLTKGTREYFDTVTRAPKAIEEISIKTKQGIVKPTFVGREFEHIKGHKKDPKDKHREGLRITEIYRLSINGNKGELHLTLETREDTPVKHDVRLHDISHDLVESLIITLRSGKIKPDQLAVARIGGVELINLGDDLKPIAHEKLVAVKSRVQGKDWMGEYLARNKEHLQKIEASKSMINMIYSGFEGPHLLEHGDTWTTFDPCEDGHVVENNGYRYGTAPGNSCYPYNDAYIEVPNPPSPKRRAYFEYCTDYLSQWVNLNLNVTQIKFRCNRVAGSAYACSFKKIDNRPSIGPCPDPDPNDVANNLTYNQIASTVDPGTGAADPTRTYRNLSLAAGNDWKVISDTYLTPPGINSHACDQLEARVYSGENWFAFGIMKQSETTNIPFIVQIQAEEYQAAADPLPTLEVTFTHT